MNEAVLALAPVVIVALWAMLTPLAGRALANRSGGPRATARHASVVLAPRSAR